MSSRSQGGIAKASTTFPHPRLLGSLKVMLARHYRSGMTVDTLSFDEVLANDQSVTGPEYVDVPVDGLPELKGSNFWWQRLPASGESAISGFGAVFLFLFLFLFLFSFLLIVQNVASLRADPSPVVPLKVGGSSKAPEPGPSGMKLKLKLGKPPAPAQGTSAKIDGESDGHVTMAMGNLASDTGKTGTAGASGTGKGKKRPAKDQDDGARTTKKKKEVKSKEFVDTDEDVEIVAVGPSKDKGKQRHVPTPSEGSEEPEASASKVRELWLELEGC